MHHSVSTPYHQHDVLLIHVHGVVILLAQLIQYGQNDSEEKLAN